MVEIQGEVKATTDLSDYTSPEWITFENVDGLIVTGDGVVNGQGEKTWNRNGCDKDDCPHAPSVRSITIALAPFFWIRFLCLIHNIVWICFNNNLKGFNKSLLSKQFHTI